MGRVASHPNQELCVLAVRPYASISGTPPPGVLSSSSREPFSCLLVLPGGRSASSGVFAPVACKDLGTPALIESIFGLALPRLPKEVWTDVSHLYPSMAAMDLDQLTPVLTDVAESCWRVEAALY